MFDMFTSSRIAIFIAEWYQRANGDHELGSASDDADVRIMFPDAAGSVKGHQRNL